MTQLNATPTPLVTHELPTKEGLTEHRFYVEMERKRLSILMSIYHFIFIKNSYEDFVFIHHSNLFLQVQSVLLLPCQNVYFEIQLFYVTAIVLVPKIYGCCVLFFRKSIGLKVLKLESI